MGRGDRPSAEEDGSHITRDPYGRSLCVNQNVILTLGITVYLTPDSHSWDRHQSAPILDQGVP